MSTHNQCGLCHIQIENLSVISGGDVLLEDVNLEFHCGQLTALIGRNGAGKTTLLKAILGQRAYTGRISYTDHHGQSIKQPRIGYVPQQLEFDRNMPLTVLDLFSAATQSKPVWWRKGNKQACEKKLAQMDCEALAEKRLGDLSGGELQRVLLALATDPIPDLLILDEPVSGVDAVGLELFYKRVTELLEQYHMAILLVSHDLSLIEKFADKVVLLDKTVAAEGDAQTVFSTSAFRESFGYLLTGGEKA